MIEPASWTTMAVEISFMSRCLFVVVVGRLVGLNDRVVVPRRDPFGARQARLRVEPGRIDRAVKLHEPRDRALVPGVHHAASAVASWRSFAARLNWLMTIASRSSEWSRRSSAAGTGRR